MSVDELKAAAAEAAVEREVRSGMRLGLGTGSTAAFVLDALAARLGDGRLDAIVGVPTSEARMPVVTVVESSMAACALN